MPLDTRRKIEALIDRLQGEGRRIGHDGRQGGPTTTLGSTTVVVQSEIPVIISEWESTDKIRRRESACIAVGIKVAGNRRLCSRQKISGGGYIIEEA